MLHSSCTEEKQKIAVYPSRSLASTKRALGIWGPLNLRSHAGRPIWCAISLLWSMLRKWQHFMWMQKNGAGHWWVMLPAFHQNHVMMMLGWELQGLGAGLKNLRNASQTSHGNTTRSAISSIVRIHNIIIYNMYYIEYIVIIYVIFMFYCSLIDYCV